MWFKLTGATFTNNLGTMSELTDSWSISKSLSSSVSISNTATSVAKDNSYSATLTIASGYELSSYKLTMGGSDVTNSYMSVNGNTIAISIAKVTGNISIVVVAKNTSSGSEDSGSSVFSSDNSAIYLTDSAVNIATATDNNGASVVSSYFNSKKIDISSYSGKWIDFTFASYTTKAGASSSYSCHWIDSSGNFTLIATMPKCENGASSGKMLVFENIAIPSTAKYIQITWFSNGAVTNGVYSGNVSDFAVRVKSAKSTNVSNLTGTFAFTDGKAIVASTGEEASSGVFAASNYVDITNVQLMEIEFMTWTSATGAAAEYGYAFYDNKKQFIMGYSFPQAESSLGNSAGTSYTLTVLCIPSTAAYMRTTYPKDTSTYGSFSASANIMS